jgi:hypothetical protein
MRVAVIFELPTGTEPVEVNVNPLSMAPQGVCVREAPDMDSGLVLFIPYTSILRIRYEERTTA